MSGSSTGTVLASSTKKVNDCRRPGQADVPYPTGTNPSWSRAPDTTFPAASHVCSSLSRVLKEPLLGPEPRGAASFSAGVSQVSRMMTVHGGSRSIAQRRTRCAAAPRRHELTLQVFGARSVPAGTWRLWIFTPSGEAGPGRASSVRSREASPGSPKMSERRFSDAAA